VDTVAHWWNGTWGRLARQDVYLRSGQLWQVELREGGAEGRTKLFTFDNEAEARAQVDRALKAVDTPWRELAT
jgi:hypothetical protein